MKIINTKYGHIERNDGTIKEFVIKAPNYKNIALYGVLFALAVMHVVAWGWL